MLHGCLHLPSGPRRASVGVVICNPFGYEAICAHRSLRSFAVAAAQLGLPTLRFDYRGTGDSADSPAHSDQLEDWGRDTVAAIDELRRCTGVTKVVLLGFRLGVLAAVRAAAVRDCVRGFAAVAPVSNGKRHLRELRTIQMAAGKQSEETGSAAAAGMEVSGFLLSAATVAALTDCDLGAAGLPAFERVLILDRAESPGARAWADQLRASQGQLEYVAAPGFVRMMMTQPHLAMVPQAMVAATAQWLEGFLSAPVEADAAPGAGWEFPPTGVSNPSELPVGDGAADPPVTERHVVLTEPPEVLGVVTAATPARRNARGVLLLNAGATHRIGPNRMHVTLARRWAGSGHTVLRLDLAGLGESGVRPGCPENEVYPPAALEDLRRAIGFLRDQYGVEHVTLAGLCSGAYHSLRAAVAGLPVDQILMVNPLNYRLADGKTQSDLQWLGFIHNPRLYVRQVIPSRFWKKLVARQINLPRLAKLYLQFVLAKAESGLGDACRAVRLPLPNDLGSELVGIAGRRIRALFVFARGDFGLQILRNQAGSGLRRAAPAVRVEIIDGADHIFSQSAARAELEAVLTEELMARGPGNS